MNHHQDEICLIKKHTHIITILLFLFKVIKMQQLSSIFFNTIGLIKSKNLNG